MIIGVLREARTGERRVSATPQTVTQLIDLGYEVIVDPGAGAEASFPDAAYVASGASIGNGLAADILLGVNPPSRPQLERFRPGATLIGMLNPALDADLVADLAKRPITALAMDAVPRISRAQSMDVLSSMGSVAGYRAVLEAAHQFGRFFTGQVTAAGKVPPTKVLVVGAGVAGLAAIGTARSLGAIVRATDPRPEVAEQVESLGGKYIAIESPEVEISATGYAKEMGDDYKEREAGLYAAQCEDVDIIVTTALIPGRAAPRLIDAAMVASMRSGSVIVDMAAANGGNVEGTVPGEVVRTDNGVILIGYTDLAGRMPAQASQLYGTNVVNLIKLLTPAADGRLVLDHTDVVQRSITVVRDGELTWPPPPVHVSAAPTAPVSPASGPAADAPVEVSANRRPVPPVRRAALHGVLGVALFVVAALSPPALLGHLTVFALAIVVGFYVIGKVHHALHTPLMSVTNAISGIIVVGALLQIGNRGQTAVTAVSAVAILLASINVFGGFAVTQRMLGMFQRS